MWHLQETPSSIGYGQLCGYVTQRCAEAEWGEHLENVFMFFLRHQPWCTRGILTRGTTEKVPALDLCTRCRHQMSNIYIAHLPNLVLLVRWTFHVPIRHCTCVHRGTHTPFHPAPSPPPPPFASANLHRGGWEERAREPSQVTASPPLRR